MTSSGSAANSGRANNRVRRRRAASHGMTARASGIFDLPLHEGQVVTEDWRGGGLLTSGPFDLLGTWPGHRLGLDRLSIMFGR